MLKSADMYNNIGVSTEVMSASPHRLIQMLFEKCLMHLSMAKNAMIAKDQKKKMHSIAKANDIVRYLRNCLYAPDDHAKEMVRLLEATYSYVELNLVKATLENDINYIEQSWHTISEIKSAWDEIGA